jgi:hypothetical protein
VPKILLTALERLKMILKGISSGVIIKFFVTLFVSFCKFSKIKKSKIKFTLFLSVDIFLTQLKLEHDDPLHHNEKLPLLKPLI